MNFYLRRIAFYIVTLWAAISLNFLLPRLLPGDPAAIMLGKLRRANGGRPLSEETIQTITSILGAEKGMSLWDQYIAYWSRLLHGDLGVSSTRTRHAVVDLIAAALPWTIVLVGMATVISFVLGIVRRRMGRLEARHLARPARAADDDPAVDPVLLAGARARRRVLGAARLSSRSSAATTSSSSPRDRSGAGRSSASAVPRHPARDHDHHLVGRRLAARHAQHDGLDAVRGLRRHRRGEGPHARAGSAAVRGPQRRDPAASRASASRSASSSPARS